MIMNPIYEKLIRQLSREDRQKRNEMWAYMNSHPRQLHPDLEQQERELVGYTSRSIEGEGGDSPVYTLAGWGWNAIDGNQYRRKTGPNVRFRVRFNDTQFLEIVPHYITREQDEIDHKTMPDRSINMNGWEYQPCVDSNWQPGGGSSIGVFDIENPRRSIHSGWEAGYEVNMIGDQSLTDAVAARLWEIHRNKDGAFVGLPWCGVCQRPLTDGVSKALGIGPSCARQLHISHGLINARIVAGQSNYGSSAAQ